MTCAETFSAAFIPIAVTPGISALMSAVVWLNRVCIMSGLIAVLALKLTYPPSPISPDSGANILPISVSDIFLPSPFAEYLIALMSPEARNVNAAAFVVSVAPSRVNVFDVLYVNGNRKFNGISMMLARGIATTPEAVMIPSESSARIRPSMRPDASRLAGMKLMISSRDNAVRSRRAFRGSRVPESLPVPFEPICRSDETISAGENFMRAFIRRGNMLSREIISALSVKFPASSSVRASSNKSA